MPVPTWVVAEQEFKFQQYDKELVKCMKLLGAMFSLLAFMYPHNPSNKVFPFWYPYRPMMAQLHCPVQGSRGVSRRLVLANSPTSVLLASGLGGRAFDRPSPVVSGTLPSPIVEKQEHVEAVSASKLRRAVTVGDFTIPNGFLEMRSGPMGLWVLNGSTSSPPVAASILDATRRYLTLDDGVDKQMCLHYVARHCAVTEADAVAMARPPSGVLYRDWRDSLLAQVRGDMLSGDMLSPWTPCRGHAVPFNPWR